MTIRYFAAAGLLVLAACSSKPKNNLTQRERDSIIGASKLPNAAGVRGALKVSDSADARRKLEDSISKAP
jgi:hypothetical protein